MITSDQKTIFYYSLFILMLVLLFHTGVSYAGMKGEQSDNVIPAITYEGFTDFMDGRIERMENGILELMGMEFQLSDDVFCTKGEEEIPCEQIKAGDEVRITYAPDEDNRVLKIELEESSPILHDQITNTGNAPRKKKEVIVFKNGVYTNE